MESSLCQERKVLTSLTGVKVYAVFLRKENKKGKQKRKDSVLSPVVCMFFPVTSPLPYCCLMQLQEIQDGHNGYHSEAEPDQVASFTHLSFINCVARYYILVLVQYIQILYFSCKRIHRKLLVC